MIYIQIFYRFKGVKRGHLTCSKFQITMPLYKTLRGFVKLKKIQKSEKNSEVGGWVKPQLDFFLEMLLFLEFLCCFHVSECF